MPAISRAQQQKELIPGLNSIFGLEYNNYDAEWSGIVEQDTSERSFEEDLKVSGFGAAPVKAEGAGISYDTAQEAWAARYTHETIANGFAITEEALEDNLYVQASARYTRALARSFAYTKNVKCAAIYNFAFTSGHTGGDGKVLCATDHPLISGGTNSNTSSTNADLNETALEAAEIQIQGWTDERGLLIAARPRKLILPKEQKFVVTRLLKSDLRVSTTNNDVNAIKSLNIMPEGFQINHFFTITKSWYIKTDIPMGPKIFQRVKLKTSSEGDFDTGNFRYKGRERYSVGWTDPLAIWGSQG